MLDILVRSGPRQRKPPARRGATAAHLVLERLESRELLTPLPPTGLTATGISASAIALHWNAWSDPTVTGYDVTQRQWVVANRTGRYVYTTIATNVATNSYTVTGLASGSSHTYLVTALSSAGSSVYSLPATGETWYPPSFPPSGSYYVYVLSNGYESSGPVTVTARLTTQITLLAGGNPRNYSVVTGPASVSINPKSGVVTFQPTLSEVGTVNIKFRVANPLGSATETITFDVTAPNPNQAVPKVTLSGLSSTYNGQPAYVSATAVGTDGVTPVSGSFAFAYNGVPGAPVNAGSYSVLATFTSADPKYGNATALGTLTVRKGTPVFSSLSSPAIVAGTSAASVSGHIGAGTAFPSGEYVFITLNGVAQAATVNANGNFVTSFATGSLGAGNYSVTYAYPGDANFRAAPNGTSTLQVIPTAPPKVTQNPASVTITEGDPVTFTAAASGEPTPSVQWQVSTDGGVTFTNLAGATSTTLTFTTALTENGYEYRAVFTNRVGTATTSAAVLTVEADSSGGGTDALPVRGLAGIGLAPLDLDTLVKHRHGGLFL
jgi:hypothetical protein